MQFYSPYYASGNRFNFTRDSAWWAFDFVSNWMQINFKNMSRVYVYPAVAEWQQKALAVTDLSNHETDAATAFQNSIVQFWYGPPLVDTNVALV
jgi:dipeptidase